MLIFILCFFLILFNVLLYFAWILTCYRDENKKRTEQHSARFDDKHLFITITHRSQICLNRNGNRIVCDNVDDNNDDDDDNVK